MKTQLLRNTIAAAVAAAIFAAVAPAANTALADQAAAAAPSSTPLPNQAPISAIEKEWGVKILSIRLSGLGQFLDFRYRVTDAAKAAPILDRNNEPKLIDSASGKTVYIGTLPKVGRLSQDTHNVRAGRTYFMLFKNPGFVRAGSKVSIIVGRFRIDNLVVKG